MQDTAFLFPGQGSQAVGMGRDVAERFAATAGAVFARADEILGFSLSRLCFEGPEEELRQTENTQPALFVTSCAIMAVLDAQGLIAQAVAGHSLGEYSALVAAHAMQFEDALRVVRLRGELMRDAVRDTPGAMAAILGLSSEEVDAICREASPNGIVEGANYNAPNQVVISGEREAVDRASDLAKLRGARAVPLNVSAPFHCNLMAPVRDQLKPALEALSLVTPRVPVVANVSADYVRTAPEIRTALLAQVAAPVRWTETIHRLLDDGIQRFVEVGPGRVLSGLVRAVDRRAVTVQVGTVQDIERLLAAP